MRQAGPADTDYVEEPPDQLRTQVARTLLLRAEQIVKESVALFPFAGVERIDAKYNAQLADQVLQLLTDAILTGRLNARSPGIAELRQLASERAIAIGPLFSVAYVMERAALDELALDESFGSSTEPWPNIAQMVRRASFDLLSAFTTYITAEPTDVAAIDPLTTLHTRSVFLAVLDKEIQRCERFGHSFGLILLDVDRLADINENHGYGSGDRVLERIGIIVRTYFRETDWVARLAGDTFAVLLPETQREHAEALADRVRVTVAERLELHDYRTNQRVPVTVSVGLLMVKSVNQTVHSQQLLDDAKQAVDRAKNAGRNRVERTEVAFERTSTPAAARDVPPMD